MSSRKREGGVMDVDVVPVSETGNEWKYSVTLQPGVVRQVTAFEGANLNRRETSYTLRLEDGRIWEVVILSMPNRRYAWRPSSVKHYEAGQDYTSPAAALREGVIPYIVMKELKQPGPP